MDEAPTQAAEARAIIEERLDAIQSLTWDELDAYGKQTEQLVTASGRRFEVYTHAYWDMDEWRSGLNIEVKVRPETGWRTKWRYTGYTERGSHNDQVPEPPPNWVPYRKRKETDTAPPTPDPLDQLRREFEAYQASDFPKISSDTDEVGDAHADLVEFDGYVAGLISHLVGHSPLPAGMTLEADEKLRTRLETLRRDPRQDVAQDAASLLWTLTRLEQLIRLGQRVPRS